MTTNRGYWSGSADYTVAAREAVAITPDDNTDLSDSVRAVYIGGSGNLRVLLVSDSVPITLVGVVVGSVIPIWVKRVYSTGTTAINLVGLL